MAKVKTLEKVDEYRWALPTSHKEGMRVHGMIYMDREMLEEMLEDQALEQVANVAFLPGIVRASLAMPDIHWGYGFPIGGVAATRVSDGVISPGGIGFDINCGVRLLRTNLTFEEAQPKLQDLVNLLFTYIPTGVGSTGKIKLSESAFRSVMTKGARWALEQGYGWSEDLDHLEEHGSLPLANPDVVSREAVKRGHDQLGTLGSGNHFAEVQVVEELYDLHAAEVLGLHKGQVTLLIHTGSRGFGHQIATDYIAVMGGATRKYGINIPDRQLACAPVTSEEGERYFGAMACAANFAWANRQAITHWAREAFEQVFKRSAESLGMHIVYDVAHNIAKFEEYEVDGRKEKLCIHRKGATRAFPPGHPELTLDYQSIGQPVLVPGDMGRYSFVMLGTKKAIEETFGSSCHGAGRQKSRSQAKREVKYKDLLDELGRKGIFIRASSRETVTEEAPVAYKDVERVVDVCHGAGISKKVAKLRPVGVIKG